MYLLLLRKLGSVGRADEARILNIVAILLPPFRKPIGELVQLVTTRAPEDTGAHG